MKFILRRHLPDGGPWCAQQTPARPGSARARRDGVGWGWTPDRRQALHASDYWRRRFVNDMRAVNAHGWSVEEVAE